MNRWSGPFESPNQAGLILAITALVMSLLVGLAAAPISEPLLEEATIGRHKFYRRIGLTAAIIGLIISTEFLAATLSRAGWLAFLGGLFVLHAHRGISLRWLATLVGILVLQIASWPGSDERASQAWNDAVAGERLVLWKATLACIADASMGGWGDHFSLILNHWYLPQSLEGRFATALNDLLTFTAVQGLPCATTVVFVFTCIAVTAWKTRGPRLIALLMATLWAIIIAGQFQAHLSSPLPHLIFTIVLCLLVLVVIRRLASRKQWRGDILVICGIAAFTSIIFFIITLTLAALVAAQAPWVALNAAEPDGALPRGNRTCPILLLLVDNGAEADHVRELAKSSALENGWGLVVSRSDDVLGEIRRVGNGHDAIQAVVAWHEHGMMALLESQLGHIQIPVIVIDPHSSDETENALEHSNGRISPRHSATLVLCRHNAPFTPSLKELEVRLDIDTTIQEIQTAKNAEYELTVLWKWLKAL